jgi:DivIVA domain-containing protein
MIRHVVFHDVLNGYATAEVDPYLNRLASEWDALCSASMWDPSPSSHPAISQLGRPGFHRALRGYNTTEVDRFLEELKVKAAGRFGNV